MGSAVCRGDSGESSSISALHIHSYSQKMNEQIALEEDFPQRLSSKKTRKCFQLHSCVPAPYILEDAKWGFFAAFSSIRYSRSFRRTDA